MQRCRLTRMVVNRLARLRVAVVLIAVLAVAVAGAGCGERAPVADQVRERCWEPSEPTLVEVYGEAVMRANMELPIDDASVQRGVEARDRRLSDGVLDEAGFALSDEELAAFRAHQNANDFLASMALDPATSPPLAYLGLDRNIMAPTLIVRTVGVADSATGNRIAEDIERRFGLRVGRVDVCALTVPLTEWDKVQDAMLAESGRRALAEAIGAPIGTISWNVVTQVVGLRIEYGPDAERLVADPDARKDAEQALLQITGYELIVDLTTESLPRFPLGVEPGARVEPGTAEPGESITLTPTGVVGRECGGGLGFFRPIDPDEVELLGFRSDNNWSTPPMTILACEPGSSDVPATSPVPDISPGQYIVCTTFSVITEKGCGWLTIT